MLQPKISSLKNIGQQKVGPKSPNHFTNLQTMCKSNIRIWDCFYHNCFGNRRVYSTGLQGQVWQKTQVSQGNIFLAFSYHNNSPDKEIIKIYLRQHLYLMLTSK